MRISNSMMSNTILLNINRNMRRIDALYRQQSSGKRINLPSENPILAGRTLRFRTSVAETVQFRSNVRQGLSWMESTQNGFLDMIRMFETVSARVNTGSSDPSGTWQDRQKMVAEIQGILEQLSHTMNITYAGRYVFAGLRTNEPPMFTQPNDRTFRIIQNFRAADMERTTSLQSTFEIQYMTAAPMGVPAASIINRSISDPNAFNPPPNAIHRIAETGEYIIPPGWPALVPPPDTRLMSTAEPIINDIDVIRLPYRGSGTNVQSIIIPGFNAGAPVTVNVRPVSSPVAYGPLPPNEINFIPETGELIFGENVARAIRNLPANQSMEIVYWQQGFNRLEPNPIVYFNSTEFFPIQPGQPGYPGWIEGRTFTTDNQALEFEFGINTRIQVNSNANQVFTATMFAKLHAFCDFVMGLRLSDPAQLRNKFESITPPLSSNEIDRMVSEQLNREEMLIESAVRDRFSNMISIVQGFSSSVSFQETSLGVRINRLEMIDERLAQDFNTYRELLSDSEDVDFIEVLIELASAEAILAAAYRTGAGIMQLSLVNFI